MAATSTVIVAIPAVDDHVWKVSSEKVPHLTLLYLGEEVPPEDQAKIALFLQHVADVSLTRFGLSVDRRGTLGDDEADVLFFEKAWAKEIKQVRDFLLQNEAVNKAFNSTPQFEGWTPHLTLGYPGSPAHEDTRDYPISYVQFDKIALWLGDSEGPTFDLKREEYMEADVAWSDTDPDNVDDILSHYGIKGMRWGVRKSEHEGGTRAKRAPVPVSADKARAQEHAAKIGKKGDTSALSNQELQQLVQRMNLEQQYSRLAAQPSKLATGQKKVNSILTTADTGKKAYNLVAPTPVGKKIGKMLRGVAISTAVVAGKAYYKTRR